MSSRAVPSTFVKNVLQNGVGRYVCQLQRLTIKFCKSDGGSRSIRDYLENDIIDFTRNNPGIVVYLKPARHCTPSITGFYLNGEVQKMSLRRMDREEISHWINFMKTRSGVKILRVRKSWRTETPSIQGIWNPFMFKDTAMNLAKFPDPDLVKFESTEKSTSDILLELKRKNLVLKDDSDTQEHIQDSAGNS